MVGTKGIPLATKVEPNQDLEDSDDMEYYTDNIRDHPDDKKLDTGI